MLRKSLIGVKRFMVGLASPIKFSSETALSHVEARPKAMAAAEQKPDTPGKSAMQELDDLHQQILEAKAREEEQKALRQLEGASKLLNQVFFEFNGKPYTGRFVLNLIDEMARQRPKKRLAGNRFWSFGWIPVMGQLIFLGSLIRDRKLKYPPNKTEGVYLWDLNLKFPDQFIDQLHEAVKALKEGGLIDIEQHKDGPGSLDEGQWPEQFIVLTPTVRRALGSRQFFEKSED